MCGRFPAVRGSVAEVRGRPGRVDFLGVDVETLGPRARVAVALSVLVPVMLSGLLLVVFAPGLWWVFTTYGWVSFPAFGLLASGLAGQRNARPAAKSGERQLLEALREHGELTPALAALETSLSVDEADRMLGKLAEEGHLEVRARGGALSYAPWGEGRAVEVGGRREP
jgi:hypothetical protein